MTVFNCYPSINIVDRVTSEVNCISNYIDYTGFDYIDLELYGGNKYTVVTSNEELINAFLLLNINIEIKECNIHILNTEIPTENIKAHKNQVIFLLKDNDIIDPLSFNLYSRIDVSPFNLSTSNIFVYNEQQLKTKLKQLLDHDILINGLEIVIDKYYGEVFNLDVYSDPSTSLIYNGGPVECNFTLIQSIDLSYYGGNAQTIVTSANSIVSAFLALNIIVTVNNCVITFVEYVGEVAEIPVCYYPLISFLPEPVCVDNELDYDVVQYVDFDPLLGNEVRVFNNNDIKIALLALGVEGDFVGCKFKIINNPCGDNITLNTRSISELTALPDLIPCILVNGSYTLNPTINDINEQNQTLILTHINGTLMQVGGTITIATGVTVQLLDNLNIRVSATTAAENNTLATFSYTIMNEDGITSTALITYCVTNIILPTVDTVNFECDDFIEIDLAVNDQGIGAFTVTHINNTPIAIGQIIEVVTSSLTLELISATVVKLTSINMFNGMGSIDYTITNGGATSTSQLIYNIANTCDNCLLFDIDFTTSGCANTCWGDLTHNGNNINNYKLKLRKLDGTFYVLPNGEVFSIGKGMYAAGSLPPNHCIPMPAGTYNIFIEFSDIEDNLNCPSNTVTITPIACNTTCNFSYSGPGGVAAQLSFDMEVSASSSITILKFQPYSVPDGLVIKYNNETIYHTGISDTCPYIGAAGVATYQACVGCPFVAQNVTDVVVPIPYISGVNKATIIIFGYPCSTNTTAWLLNIKSTCE